MYISLEQNGAAPKLNRGHIDQILGAICLTPLIVDFIHSDCCKEWYKPVPTDPRFSPLLLKTHKGLPPAFLQVCGLDPLRDDGLIYEKVLREAGVPTKLEVYGCLPSA